MALIAGVAALLASCSPTDAVEQVVEEGIEAETGEDVELELDGDGERVSIETDDGSLSASVGGAPPDEFGAFPFPDDLQHLGGLVVDENGARGYRGNALVAGTAEDVFDQLMDFYEGNGFEVEVDAAGSGSLQVVAPDGEMAGVFSVTDAGDETLVSMLMAHPDNAFWGR